MKNNVVLIIIFSFFLPVFLYAGDFDYPQSKTLSVNTYSYKVIAEDVNNDNLIDIITAGTEFVSIHLNQGDNTFTRTDFPYQGGGQYGMDMCAIDINNDNYIDLAFSNETSEYWSYLTFILNNGSGGFLPYQQTNSYAGSAPTDIDAADFDNNGFTDIVTTNYWGESITVHYNNGAGDFDTTRTLVALDNIYCVTASDIDQDGDIDIAGATLGGNNLLIIKNNNNDSTFTDHVRYPAYFSSYSICSADLNNDTYPDMITSIETGEYMGYLAVFLNNGLGEFSSMTTYYTESHKAGEVIAVDLNNDNYLDLAVVGLDNNLKLYKNDQTGAFSIDTTYHLGNGVESLASDDFDNDGIKDLVVLNQSDNTLSVLFSNLDPECCNIRGDVNNDGNSVVDISDLLFLVDYMFSSPGVAPVPVCLNQADINGDTSVDISDMIYLIDYMFLLPGQAPAPVPCP